MNKTFASVATALVLGATTLTSVAPASAQSVTFGFSNRDQYVSRYCDRNPRDRDCRDYRSNGRRWSDNDYRRWYNSHRNSNGVDNLAAGIFGFAAGAAIAGSAARNNAVDEDSSHIDRCEARYRSYDARTDSFLGNDGRRHECNL